jgi:hypothetical protein
MRFLIFSIVSIPKKKKLISKLYIIQVCIQKIEDSLLKKLSYLVVAKSG